MLENSAKILIADDDATSRTILEAILRQYGCEVVSFSDGRSALEELERDGSYSVAVLDWIMPGCTGIDICRHFHTKESLDTYLILLTSKYGLDDLVEGFAAGAHDYLQKPCEPEELIARIRVGIRLHGMQKQIREYADSMEHLAQERAQQLLHADRLSTLGILSAGMAHEINNPLSFIQGNSKFLGECWPGVKAVLENAAEQGRSNDQAALFLEEFEASAAGINKGVDRISHIVDSLKLYARKEGGVRRLCSLADLIEQSFELCRNRLKYNIAVNFNREDDAVIYCCDQQIEQVFINLIINAADALENIENGEIAVRIKKDGKFVQVTVCDNGTGFPESAADKLFTPFFTTKEIGKGTGLGLSICEGIITDHGGKIRALCSEPRGACIELTLPLAKGESA